MAMRQYSWPQPPVARKLPVKAVLPPPKAVPPPQPPLPRSPFQDYWKWPQGKPKTFPTVHTPSPQQWLQPSPPQQPAVPKPAPHNPPLQGSGSSGVPQPPPFAPPPLGRESLGAIFFPVDLNICDIDTHKLLEAMAKGNTVPAPGLAQDILRISTNLTWTMVGFDVTSKTWNDTNVIDCHMGSGSQQDVKVVFEALDLLPRGLQSDPTVFTVLESWRLLAALFRRDKVPVPVAVTWGWIYGYEMKLHDDTRHEYVWYQEPQEFWPPAIVNDFLKGVTRVLRHYGIYPAETVPIQVPTRTMRQLNEDTIVREYARDQLMRTEWPEGALQSTF